MSNYSEPIPASPAAAAPEGVLEINGPLTISNVAAWRCAILEEWARHPDLRVDLSRVTACDTAGLQLLCAILKMADGPGRTPPRVQVSEPILRAAAALGLAEPRLSSLTPASL